MPHIGEPYSLHDPRRRNSVALPEVLQRWSDPNEPDLYGNRRLPEPLPVPSVEPLPGRSYQPAYDPMSRVDPRLRIEAAGRGAYGESRRQSEATELEMEGLRTEVAKAQQGIAPVDVPGVGKVQREALPIIQQREAAREAERLRNTLTANQEQTLGIARERLQSQFEIAQARLEAATAKGEALRPVQTVNAQGRTVTKFIRPEEGQEVPVGQTADMRNKEASRALLVPAINALEALSQRVITKPLSIQQKAESLIRGLDAALANDPDFRTYQDARMALAGNLAVAQQGSRPSDADIRAIWLPLVPDVFKDTEDSAEQKWQMIRINSGLSGGGGQTAQPQGGIVRMRAPDGRSLNVPANEVAEAERLGATRIQ